MFLYELKGKDKGKLKFGVGRWLTFTLGREVNEGKGHFRVQSGQRFHPSICPCLQTQCHDRSARVEGARSRARVQRKS